MDRIAQIVIIIVLIIVVFYLTKPPNKPIIGPVGEDFMVEGFTSNDPGYMPGGTAQNPQIRHGNGLRHPNQDLIYATINSRCPKESQMWENATWAENVDPDTLAKLKDTILTDVNRRSKTEVAFNDIGVERTNQVRPFNDVHSRLSQAQANNFRFINDSFDNSYFQLWNNNIDKEADQVLQMAEEIEKSKLLCIPFKHVNQCMSVCSNTDNCSGFYVDSPNKCCMLLDPPYTMNRHSWNRPPDNIDAYGHRTLTGLIRRSAETDGKVVFDYVRTDDGNGTYKVDMDRQQCKSLCPKCIVGRCPQHYRCTNLTSDPRYNFSCLITNEDRYDETTGRTFDNPKIPYLDDKYGLNQYAGYDDQNQLPMLVLPETHKIRLDDRIVPNRTELNAAFAKFDSEHVGPETYRKKCMGSDSCENFGLMDDLDDPFPMTNLFCCHDYIPSTMEKSSAEIAVRGGNDPVNMEAYYDTTMLPIILPKREITRDLIERDLIERDLIENYATTGYWAGYFEPHHSSHFVRN